MLIQDTVSLPLPLPLPLLLLPPLSHHMTEVLRALCQHVLPAPDMPKGPSPTPSTAREARTAMYAQAVNTATDHVGTPIEAKSDTTKQPSSHSPSLHPTSPRLESTRPDLIFRFDLETRKPWQTHPVTLFADIGPKTIRDLHIGGFRWTQGGNLAINFAPGYRCTTMSEFHAAPVPAIWLAIRPLIGFRKHPECPHVDGGSSWHSVAVHDVPLVRDTQPRTSPSQWLSDGGFQGSLESLSILGSDETLKYSEVAPVRLALSRADAEFLVENGALLFGSRCRVSHYVARSHVRQRSRSAPSDGTLSTPMPH
ncbi:hypothetical protein C8R44DRAFT_736092 [Mycena epipterygia]|nr:hypothetical protein C8R44DRAFT_736092 [Mycena epipterygia]